MKKALALFALISFALICSCQKQHATAEQQLAERKRELDVREKALDEREKAFAERKKLVVRPRVAPVRRTPAARAQRVAPDLQGGIADPNQESLEREQRIRERVAERQRKMEEVQRTRTPAVPPQATTPSTDEANSVSPSPTPE
jgi:hypothetical protein